MADDFDSSIGGGFDGVFEPHGPVERLVEVMRGLDPEWSLAAWMSERAEEDLNLLNADLGRKRLHHEQRIHRIERLLERVEPSPKVHDGQRNLFDAFDLKAPSPVKLRIQEEDALEPEPEAGPVSHLLSFIPGDHHLDDPLLAIVAQNILMEMERLGAAGEPASLDQILRHLGSLGITEDEIDEGIDHLLMRGVIIEIDDDVFILDD